MEKPSNAHAKKRVYVIVVAALLWSAVLLTWLLTGGTRSETLAVVLTRPRAVMASIVAFMAVFWPWFWIRSRKASVPAMLLALRMFSGALLVLLLGGALVWNWPWSVLSIVGTVLVLSYAARFVNSAAALALNAPADLPRRTLI